MAVVIPIISEWNAKGVNRAMADIQKAGSKFDKFSIGVGAASRVATVGLAGIAAASFKMIQGLEKANQANAALDNVLNSMGYPTATKRVSEYAEALEKSLAVDADIIKATQTKLATFGELTKTVNEAGGAFDRATLAALDMAAAGFGSAEGNAVQLGKALNDPIKGINALTKSGITFTAQEKELIKTLVESGKTLEAQDMILAAIEKQVGGTAAATALGSEKMKLAFAAAADSIALALMPAFESLTAMVLKFTPIIEANGDMIGKVILVFGAFAAAIIALNYAIKAYVVITKVVRGVTLAWIAVQTVLNVLLIANPIGLIVIAIAAFVAAIILAYKKSDTFRAIVDGLFQMLKNVGNFIKNVLIGYFKLWLGIIDKVKNAVKGLVDRLKPIKEFFGGSNTVNQNLNVNQSSSNSKSSFNKGGSYYMTDELVARGIANILSKSDLRNGQTIGFA